MGGAKLINADEHGWRSVLLRISAASPVDVLDGVAGGFIHRAVRKIRFDPLNGGQRGGPTNAAQRFQRVDQEPVIGLAFEGLFQGGSHFRPQFAAQVGDAAAKLDALARAGQDGAEQFGGLGRFYAGEGGGGGGAELEAGAWILDD